MGIWRPKINQVMICGIIVRIENIYVLYLNAFLSVDYLKAPSVGHQRPIKHQIVRSGFSGCWSEWKSNHP